MQYRECIGMFLPVNGKTYIYRFVVRRLGHKDGIHNHRVGIIEHVVPAGLDYPPSGSVILCYRSRRGIKRPGCIYIPESHVRYQSRTHVFVFHQAYAYQCHRMLHFQTCSRNILCYLSRSIQYVVLVCQVESNLRIVGHSFVIRQICYYIGISFHRYIPVCIPGFPVKKIRGVLCCLAGSTCSDKDPHVMSRHECFYNPSGLRH